jgi:hypothetical protein
VWITHKNYYTVHLPESKRNIKPHTRENDRNSSISTMDRRPNPAFHIHYPGFYDRYNNLPMDPLMFRWALRHQDPPGYTRFNPPSHAFLITGTATNKQALFDLGIGKDWDCILPLSAIEFIENYMPLLLALASTKVMRRSNRPPPLPDSSLESSM